MLLMLVLMDVVADPALAIFEKVDVEITLCWFIFPLLAL
jgi:hypothetical protein